MKQEEPHHHFQNIIPWLISSNPNPNGNNANYFPLASSASFHHHLPQCQPQLCSRKQLKWVQKSQQLLQRKKKRGASSLTTTTMPASMMTSPSEHGFGFQDYYMMNHHYPHHHGVGEAFDGGSIAGEEKNDVGDDGGGETRDFLGLRSLMSHNEILSFANNLGNCINTSASEQQQRYSHQD